MMKKRQYGLEMLLFLLPFLDFISCFNNTCFGICLGMKAIFLLYSIFYLIKKKENQKIFGFLGMFLFLYVAYLIKTHLNIWLELKEVLTLFSLPIFILFFSQYENTNINKKNMTIVSLFYFSFFIIGSLFHLTIPYTFIYILLITFLSSIVYIMESNCYLLKLLFFLLFLIASLYINAKTFYLSILFIGLLYLVLNWKKVVKYCQKNYLKTLIALLVFALAFHVYLPKMKIENILPLPYTSLNELLSGRIENLKSVNQSYLDSNGLQKLLGLGTEKLENTAFVEMDIFDIFYSIGIVGSLFYVLSFIYVLKKTHLQKNYLISFLYILLLSFLGNVLQNPYLILFIAILFIISKNDKGIMKKDILFVSNMYPDTHYPHYGIFVQNSYALLKENGYSMDLVVMYKTMKKMNKLISYVRLFGNSLIKATFNNYDYVYVHFASHTPFGIYLPYICSKNTKLVINVHGNDVVPDTKIDQKYIKFTKVFLKVATTIIAPSHYFKKILIKNYGISKNRIVVYPSGGIDTSLFKKINKKTALKNAGLDSKYKYYGYVGRISKNKGYDTYLKAIYELKKEKSLDKNIRFILVGSGTEEENLEKLLKKYKLEKIVIRKPMVSQDELVNLYNSFEALIYPTRMQSESLGLTGLEAMACGVLVIGPNVYGPSDYLSPANSIIFDPTDSKDLVKKLKEVMHMKTKDKNKLTKCALEAVEAYTYENTKDILLSVFEK